MRLMFLVTGLQSSDFGEDSREKMVDNVGIDDTMEQVAANEPEITVNCSKSTLDKGPGISLIVRQLWMSVMQIGNSDYHDLLVMFNG